MDAVDELVTIDAASRLARVSPSAIGYWIVTGQLQAVAADKGRMVNLAAVKRLVQQTNLPAFRHISGESEPGEAPETPHTSEAVTAAQVMTDVASNRPDDPVRLELAERLLRAEQRVRGLEEALAELRTAALRQDARIRQLEEQILGGLSDEAREDSASRGITQIEEPLLTFRLLPATAVSASEPEHGIPSGELGATGARRELTKLKRDTETPVPIQLSDIAVENPKAPAREKG